MKKILKKTFISTIPVMTGYLVLGFGFGIVIKSAGFSTLLALAFSIFTYAGAMQYAAVGLLTSGASLVTVALTTLMVNARHLFYGISMLEKYKKTGKTKPYLIFALTDETYSLVCGDLSNIPEERKKDYYFFVSLFNQIYWVTGTLLGALIGSVFTFNSQGIDFALTALFITVFLDQWLTSKDHSPALIGLSVSALCLLIFGAEGFLIPAMIVIAIWLCARKEGTVND